MNLNAARGIKIVAPICGINPLKSEKRARERALRKWKGDRNLSCFEGSESVSLRPSCWRGGKALGTGKGKALGSGLVYEYKGQKFNKLFDVFDRNFDIRIGTTALVWIQQ